MEHASPKKAATPSLTRRRKRPCTRSWFGVGKAVECQAFKDESVIVVSGRFLFRSQPRVHGFALKCQHAEDALVHPSKGLAPYEAF